MSSGFVSKVGVDVCPSEGLPDVKKLEINPITSLEEFCPEGGQLLGFLDDIQHVIIQSSSLIHEESPSES